MKFAQWRELAPEWKHLRDVKFPQAPKRKTVDLLIGMDHADLHAAIREIYGKPGEPIARLTPLGWTCVGKTKKRLESSTHSSNLSYFVSGGINEINRTLEKFWEIEKPGLASPIQCMCWSATILILGAFKYYHTGLMIVPVFETHQR